jgi:hypothetical protein
VEASLPDLIASAKDLRMEGLDAKRRDNVYEPVCETGAWQKMRVNRGRRFVLPLRGRIEDVRRAGV